MPKRKDPTNYQPPPLNLDYAPFDEEALGRAISATQLEARPDDPGAPKSILDRLNCAATWFRHDKGFSERPTPSTEMGHLKSIASALGKLELLLPIKWEEDRITGERDLPHVARGVERLLIGPLNELLQTGGDGGIADLVEIVDHDDMKPIADEILLHSAAHISLVRRAVEIAIAKPKVVVADRARVAEKELIASLVDIFSDLFGRTPGLSKNPVTNAPRCPLFRFVKACLAELGETPKDGALYDQIRSVVTKPAA